MRWTSSQIQVFESPPGAILHCYQSGGPPGAVLHHYHSGVHASYPRTQLVRRRFPSTGFCVSVPVFTQQTQTVLHAGHAQGPGVTATGWTGAISLHCHTEGSLLTALLPTESQRGPLFRPQQQVVKRKRGFSLVSPKGRGAGLSLAGLGW